MFKSYRAVLFAGLAVLAAAASSSDRLPTRATAMTADLATTANGPLSVMTYNIKGLPWPVATGREAALDSIADRLSSLRRAGRQPHIVLLQEAFTPQTAQIAARAGYAYVAVGPDAAQQSSVPANTADDAYLGAARWDRGERVGKQLGSGLLILSDYPVLAVNRMAFPDFACAGFDCLANKGVLIAHLRVPGIAQPVSVINTHLNARKAAGVPVARSQRAFERQVDLMARFVADHVPTTQPVVLGGDMNIGKDDQRHRAFFTAFARSRLAFVRQDAAGARRALAQSGCTHAGDRDDLIQASQGAKDWLFARASGNRPMPIASAHVPFGSEPDGVPLSDHFGYVINYRPGGQTRLAARRLTGGSL